MLWIFQMFSLLWFPTLVALVSCDAIALDVYRGTLRYVLLRSTRSSYFAAKMVSHFVLYAVLQALSLVVVLVYSLWDGSQGKAESLRLAVQYFIVFLPFLWCVLAATLFMSSFARRPMNALIRIHVLWVAFIFIVAVEPWASPLWSKLVLGLFVPFDNYPLMTAVGYTLWGALFSLVGLLIFKRRDV
jgi:ABC-type transport system involved in multi-copper enzyme maturation permease subunit